MRAKEFITEKKSIGSDSNYTLPATYVLPGLPNQDAYLQYRMGLILASSGPDHDFKPDPQSSWGEDMAITAFSSGEEQILRTALKASGQTAEIITTEKSEEPKTVNKVSPVAAKKKNRFGI